MWLSGLSKKEGKHPEKLNTMEQTLQIDICIICKYKSYIMWLSCVSKVEGKQWEKQCTKEQRHYR